MKRNALIGLIVGIFIALIAISNSYAAGSNSLTFTETYKEKLVCYNSYGYCDVVGSSKFTVSAKILLDGIDISQFNSDTSIGISVEGFSFSGTLGEAVGGFNPKKKSAKFIVSGEDIDEINRSYLTVALSWSKTSMTVKVTCITFPWVIEWPIIAYYYIGENGPISDEFIYAQIDINDDIYDLSVGFDLYPYGSAKTKTTNKKALGEYDTSTITVKASGSGLVLLPDSF